MNPVAEININKLIGNYNYINHYVGQSNILAVVKANAYGHGAIKISRVLEEVGVFGLCVAMINELIELREAKITLPILHLGILNKESLELYQSSENICTINSIDDIYMINDFLKGTSNKIYCHIKFDTGMGRLGIPYDRANQVISTIKKNNNIKLLGIYSHFASSDESDNTFTDLQLKRFKEIIRLSDSLIPESKNYHISNSAGLLKNDFMFFNSVRAGISLYGVNKTNIEHNLNPVMKLKAPVIFIKNINKGDSVGYNRKFIADRDIKIGYIQIGYEDGYPHQMEGTKMVEFKGSLLEVVGKVSMDLTAINFTDIDVNVGDWVTLFGGQVNKLEDFCFPNKLDPYSMLTGVGNRVSRKYIHD